MTNFKTLSALALLTAVTFIANPAHAQNWGNSYQNGSNWGQQNRTDWNMQRGTVYQNQGAAMVGGILGGIGGALSTNPRNQQAGAIIGGIGNGFMNSAGRHDYNRGSIIHSQRGYGNNWGNNQGYFRPQPSYRPSYQPSRWNSGGGIQPIGGFGQPYRGW